MFGVDSTLIVTQALFLMGLLYAFARHEADFEFSTTVLVMCGIIGGNAILFMLTIERLGLFVIIPVFLFTWWMIVQFCWVPADKGLLITFLFFVLSTGVEVGKIWYRTGMMPWNLSEESASEEAMNNHERDMKEGLEVYNDLVESTARMEATARGETLPSAPEAGGKTASQIPAPPTAGKLRTAAAPPAASAATGDVANGSDWDVVRSRLRIRGWVDAPDNTRSALVNGQIVPVGGTAYVDHLGIRYTWLLVALNGYAPTWEPVGAVPIPTGP